MIDIINATIYETAKRVQLELETAVDPTLALRLFIHNRSTKEQIPYSDSQDHFAEYIFSGEEEAEAGDIVSFDIDCTVLYEQAGQQLGKYSLMVYSYDAGTEKLIQALQPGLLKLHKVLPLGA